MCYNFQCGKTFTQCRFHKSSPILILNLCLCNRFLRLLTPAFYLIIISCKNKTIPIIPWQTWQKCAIRQLYCNIATLETAGKYFSYSLIVVSTAFAIPLVTEKEHDDTIRKIAYFEVLISGPDCGKSAWVVSGVLVRTVLETNPRLKRFLVSFLSSLPLLN